MRPVQDRRYVVPLLILESDPKATTYISPVEDLLRAMATLDRVKAGCEGKYLGVTNPPQFRRTPQTIDIDLELWCQTAADKDAVVKRSVQNLLAYGGGQSEFFEKELKKLESNDGFLHLETEWETQAVFDLPALIAALTKGDKPFLDAAGMTVDDSLFTELRRLHDELWALIERLAPTWTFPDAKAHHASEAMAKTAVMHIYPGAKIVKSGMENANYELDDGQEARFWTGWILFQVPGETVPPPQLRLHGDLPRRRVPPRERHQPRLPARPGLQGLSDLAGRVDSGLRAG